MLDASKKNFTAQELKKIYGDDWRNILRLSPRPILRSKPVIKSFADFPADTQQIYIKIAKAVKLATDTPFQLWAIGSRVKGTWRTKEEEEKMAAENNIKVKYSDYDYYTTGRLPTQQQLEHVGLSDVNLHGMTGAPLTSSNVVEIPVE